jgi:hypothetical protein
MSWLCPALRWKEINVHFISSAFTCTSRTTPFLMSNKYDLFYCMIYLCYLTVNSHNQHRPKGEHVVTQWHYITLSPCFRLVWTEKLPDKYLPIRTLLYVSVKHILISLTSFMGTPYSVRICTLLPS